MFPGESTGDIWPEGANLQSKLLEATIPGGRTVKNPLLALALAFVLPALAGAETLYNQDGVQLSATARSIDPGAAICRIREERHTTEQYERLKANDGQPLNVWRVELVVANYSGKVLDYLSAHLNVESDWPPCDHWDGPERSYGRPVVWTGPLMSIQDVGSVQPGEERREVEFVLAFHDEEPTLGRWDIDYDFEAGAASGPVGSDSPSGRATDAPSAAKSSLPAGIRADQTCSDKAVGASCWMETANQPGCYFWNPNPQPGETVTWTGDCSNGLASGVGTREWRYRNADGQAVSSGETGQFQNGKMGDGYWTIRTTDGDVYEGPVVDGERSGRWILRFRDGEAEVKGVEEGPYVSGKRNGHWVLRSASGTVEEGPYVDGKKHGRWVERQADGDVREWDYVHDSLEDGRPLDR